MNKRSYQEIKEEVLRKLMQKKFNQLSPREKGMRILMVKKELSEE